MLSSEQLEDVLNRPGISNQDRALCCLALEPLKIRTVSEVRDIGFDHGWRGDHHAVYLSRAKTFAILKPDGWKLTPEGRAHVAGLIGVPKSAVPTALTTTLRKHAATIKEVGTRALVEEAISCAEHGFWRAAIVLSWVGAVSVLYDHVVAHKLAAFNAEATKRNSKWKAASTNDDLGKMDEYEFLQILPAISVLGKNVKLELESCLKRRNGCGHPSSLRVADATVAHHLEILILNVFEKF